MVMSTDTVFVAIWAGGVTIVLLALWILVTYLKDDEYDA
jgi:uncharacterized membrane protein YhdT